MADLEYHVRLVVQDPRVRPSAEELEAILERALRGLDPHLNATVTREG